MPASTSRTRCLNLRPELYSSYVMVVASAGTAATQIFPHCQWRWGKMVGGSGTSTKNNFSAGLPLSIWRRDVGLWA